VSYNLGSGEESVIEKHGKWGRLKVVMDEMIMDKSEIEIELEIEIEEAVLMHYIHPYAVIRTQSQSREEREREGEGEEYETETDDEYEEVHQYQRRNRRGVEWHFLYFDARFGWQSRMRTQMPSFIHGYEQIQMISNVHSVIKSRKFVDS
jgi:hypothetical protein